MFSLHAEKMPKIYWRMMVQTICSWKVEKEKEKRVYIQIELVMQIMPDQNV